MTHFTDAPTKGSPGVTTAARCSRLPGFGTDDDIVKAHVATAFVHWHPGLRGTGYEIANATGLQPLDRLVKRCLAQLPPNPIAWDCVLLRYPDGSSIPTHTDVERPSTVPLQHHRLFLLIKEATAGGILSIDGVDVPMTVGDAVIFEPCSAPHAVSAVTGYRLMFTVGAWHAQDRSPDSVARHA